MTPQELLDEWRKYPEAREAFAQKVHQGQATEIALMQNEILNLTWFVNKLIEMQHRHAPRPEDKILHDPNVGLGLPEKRTFP